MIIISWICTKGSIFQPQMHQMSFGGPGPTGWGA